jgi:hypothetical protein
LACAEAHARVDHDIALLQQGACVVAPCDQLLTASGAVGGVTNLIPGGALAATTGRVLGRFVADTVLAKASGNVFAATTRVGARLWNSKAIGPSSPKFGRILPGGAGGVKGALNTGFVRIGWNWVGTKPVGTNIFRIAIGPRGGFHLNYWTAK